MGRSGCQTPDTGTGRGQVEVGVVEELKMETAWKKISRNRVKGESSARHKGV